MDRYKWLCVLLTGVLIGMACDGDSVMGEALAADASACSQWETWEVGLSASVPAGWEPFAAYVDIQNLETVALRRCVD